MSENVPGQSLAGEQFHPTLFRCAAIAAATLALLNMGADTAPKAAPDNLIVLADGDARMSMPADQACPEVPMTSLLAVNTLLINPRPFEDLVPASKQNDNNNEQPLSRRQTAAEDYGLTVHGDTTTFTRLEKDLANGGKLPIVDYFQTVKDFAANYHVKVVMPKRTPRANLAIAPIPFSAPNVDHLNHGQEIAMRKGLVDVGDDLMQLPAEFISMSGLRKINLVRIKARNIDGLADVFHGDEIYLDLTKSGPNHLLDHEMTHLFDAHACSTKGMSDDPGYDGLNPADIYQLAAKDGHGPLPYTSYDAVSHGAANIKLRRMKYRAEIKDNIVASHDFEQKEAELFKDVVAIDSYSFANIREDKASLGEVLLAARDYQEIYNKQQPMLASKFAYLLARIYRANPAVAGYLVAVGNYQQPDVVDTKLFSAITNAVGVSAAAGATASPAPLSH